VLMVAVLSNRVAWRRATVREERPETADRPS
jgi:hypothetical protein